jgi:hypothetical protein
VTLGLNLPLHASSWPECSKSQNKYSPALTTSKKETEFKRKQAAKLA